MGWFLDKNYNLRKESAANHPSMFAKGAVPNTEEDIIRGLREENARLLAQHKYLFESKNLRDLALENEVLAAIIAGHLYKERLLEIVKIVLFEELDAFLDNRFTKGSKYIDDRVAEAKARIETLKNLPEQKDGK
jgi:hypothetical protein